MLSVPISAGSLLLGRPVTVLPKEPAKSRPVPNFHHMEGPPQFRPRAPVFQRGRGRSVSPHSLDLRGNAISLRVAVLVYSLFLGIPMKTLADPLEYAFARNTVYGIIAVLGSLA